MKNIHTSKDDDDTLLRNASLHLCVKDSVYFSFCLCDVCNIYDCEQSGWQSVRERATPIGFFMSMQYMYLNLYAKSCGQSNTNPLNAQSLC